MSKKKILYILCLFFVMAVLIPHDLYSQEEAAANEQVNSSLRVFLDRFWHWDDFIKESLPFITYVRDTRQAQVYVLQTRQHTSKGGDEFTFTFVGQENFAGINDTLKYISKQDDTDLIQREGLLKYLKMGLMRYISHTSIAEGISITHKASGRKERPVLETGDKWNYWVFRINTDFDLEEEESYRESSVRGSFSAARTTEAWKTGLNFSSYYHETINETGEETFKTYRKRNEFFGLLAKSINSHWSVGFIGEYNSDTRINTDMQIGLGPAIEFNIFPFEIYTRRNITFQFALISNFVRYREETIFDKTREYLNYAFLNIGGEIIEKWGDARMSLEGIVYLHDSGVNKLDWDSNLDIRLFKGFSLDLGFELSLIHDQLYLPKGDRTINQILLRRTQLKTSWRYEASIGFSYTFGSPYESIVNPRFN